MDVVDVTPNQKGSIGETLVLRGRTVPQPISEAIEIFVWEEYEVAQNTPIRISDEHAMYVNASTGDGDYMSTRTDGSFSAKWIPRHRESEVTTSPDGQIQNRWELMDESALFPVEVKTGQYAELERDQRETLETVASADTREHPLLVRIHIDKLPDQYEVSVRFL